ncbi:DUF2894 domain-containing protein [Roseateles paludis]|uniref:DUF2894 domain-containing protein n=1 Tax=Roseateles paludis TaxID=3145238 RepID=A0ABV0FZV2_9BURK
MSEPDAIQHAVLQGLARRAAAASGPLREAMEVRMKPLAQRPAPPPAAPAAPRARPWADLLARLGTEARARPQAQAALAGAQRLSLQRHLADLQAPLPEQLGPLNNEVLARRALQQLQALSPAYLQRLATQLTALAALAPLASEPAPPKPASPASKPRSKATAPRRR